MAVRITEENFCEEVLESPEPILIDFWARWCGPCRMLAPVLEELEQQYEDLRIGKVDIDMWPGLAMRYEIEAVPTLIYFKNGEPQARLLGLQSKAQIEAMMK